jgi:hypothetical protein
MTWPFEAAVGPASTGGLGALSQPRPGLEVHSGLTHAEVHGERIRE